MEEQNKQNPKIIEMAKKRRHIHLLEKLQRGKSASPTLNKSELKELEQFENDPNSPGIVDTLEKIAKIFGVSVRTVTYWKKDGMPVTSKGKYNLEDIHNWRKFKKQQKKISEKKTIPWDVRFREFKARTAELNFKRAIGELIPRDIVEKEIIQVSLGIKRLLLALPQQVAPQLVGLDSRQICNLLTARITEAIKDIAEGKKLVKKIKNVKATLNDLDVEDS